MKKMIKRHRARLSLKENAKELANLEMPDEEGEWCWLDKRQSHHGGEGELTHDQHSSVSPKITKTVRHQGD